MNYAVRGGRFVILHPHIITEALVNLSQML